MYFDLAQQWRELADRTNVWWNARSLSDNLTLEQNAAFLSHRQVVLALIKGPAAFAVGQRATTGRSQPDQEVNSSASNLPQPLCVQSCHGRYGLSWRYLKDICGSLSIIWVMMGLRFMGASPSQEGKWLPYWLPYQFALGHCGPYLRLIAVSFISALRAAIGSCRAVAACRNPRSPRHRRTFESCS